MYAPAGKTPVIFVLGGTRQKRSMVATIASHGKSRWMLFDEAFKSDKLIEFLEALIKDASRKVGFSTTCGYLTASRSSPVWKNGKKIALFYLPSHSPELNPEERLNADLKQAIGSKVQARTTAKLKAAATEHMRTLEKSPEHVKKYFRGPRVKYSA